MKLYKWSAAKVACLGVAASLATPVVAARIEVSANAGHHLVFPNGQASNETVWTDQHSIYNLLPGGGYQGDLVKRDNGVVTYAGPGTSQARWDIAAAEPESVARAYGDLSTGKVGAFAGTGDLGFSAASAVIADTLTFNIAGADENTVTPLRLLLTLHAATADANAVYRFRLGFGVFGSFGALATPYYGTADGWADHRTWVDGTTRYVELVYNLQGASQSLGVETTLEAIASLGQTSDFYHTAGLKFQAPTGVTFTSESGVFLTAVGVPEPATWAMFIVGFGGLGVALRQRRKAVVRLV